MHVSFVPVLYLRCIIHLKNVCSKIILKFKIFYFFSFFLQWNKETYVIFFSKPGSKNQKERSGKMSEIVKEKTYEEVADLVTALKLHCIH